MLFALSRGSEGNGPERYVAYLPFVLAPGANLQVDGPTASDPALSGVWLEKLEQHYALCAGPCATDAEAISLIDQLRAALLWVSLTRNVGMSYRKWLTQVTLLEEPTPIEDGTLLGVLRWDASDGHYDSNEAVVRPEHKRLTRWELGQLSVILGLSGANFFESVSQALSFGDLSGVVEDEKLTLAIELYAAYRFELSENAQLITLIAALESLLPTVTVPATSSRALSEAKELLKAVRAQHARDSGEYSELNRLLSRIGSLQTEPVGWTLRSFVAEVIGAHPELGNRAEVSTNLTEAYDIRSRLVHDGKASGAPVHLGFLREFVPRLLTVLFNEAASAAPAR